jgi:hypothetical protein
MGEEEEEDKGQGSDQSNDGEEVFSRRLPLFLPPNAGRAGGDHQATRRAPGWAAPYWWWW